MVTGGRPTSQLVAVAIFYGAKRHRVTAINWLSIHLSHGVDPKLRVSTKGGPFGCGHHGTRAAIKVAVRRPASQPILQVVARRVGRPQCNDVTTVNDGISVA